MNMNTVQYLYCHPNLASFMILHPLTADAVLKCQVITQHSPTCWSTGQFHPIPFSLPYCINCPLHQGVRVANWVWELIIGIEMVRDRRKPKYAINRTILDTTFHKQLILRFIGIERPWNTPKTAIITQKLLQISCFLWICPPDCGLYLSFPGI